MNATDTAGVEDSSPPKRSLGWLKLVVGLLLLAGLFIAMRQLGVAGWLVRQMEKVDQLGPWGPVILGLVWIPVCVLMIPGALISLATGAALGLPTGVVAVSLGSTAGASVAFLIGRTAGRKWIAGKVAGNAKFAAIDRAVEREGWKIVLLTRLSPAFPFNLLNYALGLTKVPFWHYFFASWIGMLPGTIMFVYFGTTVKDLASLAAGETPSTGTAGTVFKYVALAATVVVTVFITRMARRALRRSLDEEAAPASVTEDES